jgi:hypothetical protein
VSVVISSLLVFMGPWGEVIIRTKCYMKPVIESRLPYFPLVIIFIIACVCLLLLLLYIWYNNRKHIYLFFNFFHARNHQYIFMCGYRAKLRWIGLVNIANMMWLHYWKHMQESIKKIKNCTCMRAGYVGSGSTAPLVCGCL